MRESYRLSVREKKYFCLTIPVEYINRNSLKLGDDLHFYLDGDKLIISDKLQEKVSTGDKYIGIYKLSKRGKRGWVTTAPPEWIFIIKGKKKDSLIYSFDEDCFNRLIIKKK